MRKSISGPSLTLLMLSIIATTPTLADQAACEAARNELLVPLRKQVTDECKRDPKNDPAWCETYYADYGNATPRPGGGMNTRMYDDIPECQKSDKK